MRVTSGSCDGEKVFLPDRVLELRNVEGHLHVARKERAAAIIAMASHVGSGTIRNVTYQAERRRSMRSCPRLAQSGHCRRSERCPLLGVKRT
jgi:hypothetical protein